VFSVGSINADASACEYIECVLYRMCSLYASVSLQPVDADLYIPSICRVLLRLFFFIETLYLAGLPAFLCSQLTLIALECVECVPYNINVFSFFSLYLPGLPAFLFSQLTLIFIYRQYIEYY
jgi:hypothetical protein